MERFYRHSGAILSCLLVIALRSSCQQIKISQEPYDVSKISALSAIRWRSPHAETVYCVADASVTNLRFSCPDCYLTNFSAFGAPSAQPTAQWSQFPQPPPMNEVTREFQANTMDQSTIAGHPTIQLRAPRADPSLNGKTLRCEGTVLTPGAQPSASPNGEVTGFRTVFVDVPIQITFLRRPRILNSNRQGPVLSPEGNRFFTSVSTPLMLTCEAEANPTATQFRWMKDGAVVGNSQQLQLSLAQFAGASIVCKANNGFVDGEGVDSDTVRIDIWDPPRVVQANYVTGVPQGLEPRTGRVKLGTTVVLECAVVGNPMPAVLWQYMSSTGQHLFNATCNEGSNTIVGKPIGPYPANLIAQGMQQQAGAGQFGDQATQFAGGQQQQPAFSTFGQPVQPAQGAQFQQQQALTFGVQSRCSVSVREYTQAGQYFCMACNAVAENDFVCDPKPNIPPSYSAQFDVIGPPTLSDVPPTISQGLGADASVTVHFCADPPPQDIYWEIEGKKVPQGQRVDHYSARPVQPNTTFSDCYDATLMLTPVQDVDHGRDFNFIVVNGQGTLRQKVRIDMPGAEAQHYTNIGLAVGLSVGLFFLVLILIAILCWWRRCACFAPAQRKPPPVNKYPSNLAPGLHDVRAEPTPTKVAPPGINDSFGNGSAHSEPHTPKMSSV